MRQFSLLCIVVKVIKKIVMCKYFTVISLEWAINLKKISYDSANKQ